MRLVFLFRYCSCSGTVPPITAAPDLSTLDADEQHQIASRLVEEMYGKLALIDKLTHEIVILKRLKFAASR